LRRNNFLSTAFDGWAAGALSWSSYLPATTREGSVLALVIVIAVGAIVGGAVALVIGNSRRFDEVDRFHRASRMTTEWARRGVTKPVLPGQHNGEERRESADATRE
jgi:hypothetical protein